MYFYQKRKPVNSSGIKYYSVGLPILFCPRDCADWYKNGAIKSTVYKVYIAERYKTEVFCSMEIDGGSWIVFQKRFNGSVDFNKKWNEYKNGFGDKSVELR